jgi:hypothetical protein
MLKQLSVLSTCPLSFVKDREPHDASIKIDNTAMNFNDLYPLGIFQRDSEGEFNIVKATFYIWLDGYDADYLEGVDTESIRFFLNFTKVEG